MECGCFSVVVTSMHYAAGFDMLMDRNFYFTTLCITYGVAVPVLYRCRHWKWWQEGVDMETIYDRTLDHILWNHAESELAGFASPQLPYRLRYFQATSVPDHLH